MANAFTDTSGSSLGTSLVQTAYDRLVEFQLRSVPIFRNFASKKPAQQSMPGSSVVFQFYNDLAAATGTLTETVDPDAVAIGNTTPVTVTLNEYGNATLATRKLNLFALTDVDPAIADIVAYNMADSVDVIYQTAIRGGSTVIRNNSGVVKVNSGATNLVTSTDYLKAGMIRAGVAKLRGLNVIPTDGQYYSCVIHPDASMDLRAATGQGEWRNPQEYGVSQDRIWSGTVGIFEGAVFHENPRCYSATDGASSATVKRGYLMGRQAIAEAVAEEPHVVIGPVVDKLMRFRPIGWYGVFGVGLYRPTAMFRLESSVSIP